ncbi:unnamed protein product [Chondrus crispus]|uniref:Uncharacterized protein n=1 Tax=Chondrus crispus TaxID=2769 RepID=R7QUX4_CHOCR|nr:unnamed protein product [Chondrus crispus]CDF41281.1 unnamed protein product [Chondrus crispus]|eukprot:XP_005711575.1 unnamed protein product [Chondrus crispus]
MPPSSAPLFRYCKKDHALRIESKSAQGPLSGLHVCPLPFVDRSVARGRLLLPLWGSKPTSCVLQQDNGQKNLRAC